MVIVSGSLDEMNGKCSFGRQKVNLNSVLEDQMRYFLSKNLVYICLLKRLYSEGGYCFIFRVVEGKYTAGWFRSCCGQLSCIRIVKLKMGDQFLEGNDCKFFLGLSELNLRTFYRVKIEQRQVGSAACVTG